MGDNPIVTTTPSDNYHGLLNVHPAQEIKRSPLLVTLVHHEA